MSRIRKILIATDYSEDAIRAETRAAMLSVQLKADMVELVKAHNTRTACSTRWRFAMEDEVCASEEYQAPERSRIFALPLQMEDGSSRVTGNSRPSQEIIARAAEVRADLIVVAPRGRQFFVDLFKGRSNDDLIGMADRPVLMVNNDPRDAYRRVLVAIDFSDESKEAARAALTIAPAAHFTFLHAFSIPGEETLWNAGVSMDVVHSLRMRAREAARVALNRLIDDLGPRRQLISRAVHHGSPAAVLAAQAKRLQCDLIAMGKRGTSRAAGNGLGSVTQRVISQGRCDALVATGTNFHAADPLPAA